MRIHVEVYAYILFTAAEFYLFWLGLARERLQSVETFMSLWEKLDFWHSTIPPHCNCFNLDGIVSWVMIKASWDLMSFPVLGL